MFPDHCIYSKANYKCTLNHNVKALARSLSAEEINKWQDEFPNGIPERIAIAKRIPCHKENKVNTCQDFRLPTTEEFARHEAEMDAEVSRFLERLAIVRPAIVNDIEKRGLKNRNAQDKIPCPICKVGQVSYSYAGEVNGHIHAKCNAENCVEWIE